MKLLASSSLGSRHIRRRMEYLNSLDKRKAAVVLRKCLPSCVWVEAMILRRPFASADAAASAARVEAGKLRPVEWLEVFSGEGDVDLRAVTAGTGTAAALKSAALDRCVDALRCVDGVVDSRMDNHHVDLAWDPVPSNKRLFGGVNYHQELTSKVTHTKSAVQADNARPSDATVAQIENKQLPRFFGGAWR